MNRRLENDLRDIHGPDAEIIEMEGDAPTGRRYRVVAPSQVSKVYPWYVRALALLAMVPMAIFGLFLIFGLVVTLIVLFIILKTMILGH